MLMEALTYLFWIIILLIINSFVFYPLLMFLISKAGGKTNISEYQPTVSILISAYNEEKVIEERIKNISELIYDFSKIEVLIGSDCSSDNTNSLLKQYERKFDWLHVFIFNKRRGKAGVLNDLMKYSKNEILVFTDANSYFQNDALLFLVSHFENKKVGGVCGKLVLSDSKVPYSEGVEEKKYWEFETIIKKGEGVLGNVIGANGGIFAIRTSLKRKIPLDKPVTDDLYLSLSVLEQGFDFTFEPNAVAIEDVGRTIEIEYKRKVRFAGTNFQTLAIMNKLLYKNFFISYGFLSHKVIRWFLPFLLVLLLILNVFLISTDLQVYYLLLIFQLIYYFLSFLGFFLSKYKIRIPIFSLPFFFMITNIALLKGFINFMIKKHTVIWDVTQR